MATPPIQIPSVQASSICFRVELILWLSLVYTYGGFLISATINLYFLLQNIILPYPVIWQLATLYGYIVTFKFTSPSANHRNFFSIKGNCQIDVKVPERRGQDTGRINYYILSLIRYLFSYLLWHMFEKLLICSQAYV